jgi:hypothetical protein
MRRRARGVPWPDVAAVMSSLLVLALLTPLLLDAATVTGLRGSQAAFSPDAPDGFGLTATPGHVPLPVAQPGAEGPVTVVARDVFSRTVANGWDAAEMGGGYSVSGAAVDLAVLQDAGMLRLPAGGTARAAFLSDVSVHGVDLSFSVAFDSLPAGGPLYAYGLLRRTGTGAAYRPKMIIAADGAVDVHAGVVVGGTERSLGRPTRVSGLSAAAGEILRLRATATGSDPTTLRVRVWPDGDPEPTHWDFSAIDWTGDLQAAGGVGITGYLGIRSTAGPIVLRFDDLVATTTDVRATR